MIFVDTQIVLWYLVGDARLTPSMQQRMENELILYSSASVYEILQLKQKGRIELNAEKLLPWLDLAGFKEVPVTSSIMVLCHTLEFDHRDPWDRIIAASAHSLGCKLLTADQEFRKLSWLDTL